MYGFQPKSARGKTVPQLADGGAAPFGSRGVASVRELIPKIQAMGFQPAAPVAAPADTSNTARLRAMIPQMEAMGYKQQPQYLADGGMVHSIKGMLGLRPKTREELLAADAKTQARNQEAAARVAERSAQQPAPATPAPQAAITDYAGMSAMQRREKEQGLKNGGMVKPHGFKAGGLIRGPGTGTSDSIETEKRPGTFIMPADSTQAIGPEALEEMGEEADGMEGQGEAGDDEAVPVRLSNGEFELPPEQVQAVGEAVLTVLRNATHERSEEQQRAMPKAAGFAPRQLFADGGTVRDEEKQRLANQTAMYVQGAQAQAASRPTAPAVPTAPTAQATAPVAPRAAGFMPGTRAVFNESGKAIGDLAKQGRYAAAAGETARAALAYGPAVVDDVVGGALRAVVPPAVDAGKQFFGAGESTPALDTSQPTKTASTATPPAPPAPVQSPDASIAPAAAPPTAISVQQPEVAAPVPADTSRTAGGFVQGGAPTTIPQVTAPVVPNSTNNWAARKALENMATAASSITNRPEWQSGSTTIAGSTRGANSAGDPEGKVAAYKAALANDQALQQAQPNMEQATMRENGANQRTAVQDAGAITRTVIQDQGATTREAGRTALAQGEQEMRRTAAGFQTRAAAQQEALRNVLLDPNATPEQRKIAQRSLAALSGKTAADRMQTVNLPDTVTDQGMVVKGGQALIRTLEDGTVEQVPIGDKAGQGAASAKMPPPNARPIGSISTMNGKSARWDGAKWVPMG